MLKQLIDSQLLREMLNLYRNFCSRAGINAKMTPHKRVPPLPPRGSQKPDNCSEIQRFGDPFRGNVAAINPDTIITTETIPRSMVRLLGTASGL
ncbi:hypothetical protein CEXT_299921 [Caerostris extrusa]|uniref:Uncharacterized protein n=1 Tax=Caerostris extrusa TaxID=172846 RepID=A0AAV4X244_CAEEX|nr:hypothetical protein CEXT_299921 [Caerostris extrusa]